MTDSCEGQPWHSGNALDCRSICRVIDPAPGACCIPKIHLISPDCTQPYGTQSWPKTPFIQLLSFKTAMRKLMTESADVIRSSQ